MSNIEGIEGKIVVITGASAGLGAATARRLSSEGATVVLGARRAERLESLVNELRDAGGEAVAIATDVTKRSDVKHLVDTAVSKFGRVDVLLNNAGVMPLAPLERLAVEEWEQVLDVNVKGVLYGIAAALPHFQTQRSGHLINVSSVYGHIVVPGSAVYSATKAAVLTITEGFRQEVKPYNVRTTVISPGAVATELVNSIGQQDVAEQVKDFASKIAIPADSFARAVSFAIAQPADVDINEILFRPTVQTE